MFRYSHLSLYCISFIIGTFLGCHIAFGKAIIPLSTLAAPELRFTENKGQWSEFIKTKAEIPGGEMYLSGNALYYHFIDFDRLHAITHSQSTNKSVSGTWLKVAFLNAEKNATPQYSNAYPDRQSYFYGQDNANWISNVASYQQVYLADFYPDIDLKLYSSGQNMKYDLVAKPNADLSKIQLQYSGYKSLKLVNGSLQIETDQCKMVEMRPYAYQLIGGKQAKVSCEYILNSNMLSFKIGKNYDANYALIVDPQIVFSSFTGSKADNFGYTATYDQDGNTYVGGIVYDVGLIYELYRLFGYANFPDETIKNIRKDYPVDSFPVSAGAYQIKYQGGMCDVAIFKFSKDGKRRQYATYLGGSRTDIPQSMVVNSNNQLVVFGSTSSLDFPKTNGTVQSTGTGTSFETHANSLQFAGGSQVYLAILNESGTELIAATTIKTNGNSGINYQDKNIDLDFPVEPELLQYYNFGDEARGEVICDKNDNIIVATYSTSKQFPFETTKKDSVAGDNLDAWIFKLNPNLSALKFSTRFGGSGSDAAFGIQPDSKGNLFFAGHTTSTDLAGTLSGMNTALNGQLDGYVAKMDSTGRMLACSYLGTTENDQAFFVQTNLKDEVYVMGQTWSESYPVAANGISPFYSDAKSGQFIHKLDNNLSVTGFSTVFGSREKGPDISPTAFLVDNCGLIYVSGWRGVLNKPGQSQTGRELPLAPPPVGASANEASGFYFAVFNTDMKGINYGTYFGQGSVDHVDGGTSRFDKRGYIHQAICGGCRSQFNSLQTPTTPNVWSPTNKSLNCNMLGVKYDFETVDIKANFTSVPPLKNDTIRITAGQTINFNFSGQTITGANVYWSLYKFPSLKNPLLVSEDPSWSADPRPLPSFMALRKMQIEVDFVKSEACVQTDIQTFFVAIDPKITDAIICNGDTGQFKIDGLVGSVKWLPSAGLSNANAQNPKVFVKQDTSYSVEIFAQDNSYFNKYKAKVKVVTNAISPAFSFLSDSIGTFPLTVAFQNETPIANADFQWSMGNGTTLSGANPVYTFEKIGKYAIELAIDADNQGCFIADAVTKSVFVLPTISQPLYCQENPQGIFTVSGGTLCFWNVNGRIISNCNPQITTIGANIANRNVQVYSEPNKPYSYVFTLTGIVKPFPIATFDYTYTTIAGLDIAQVEFIVSTPVTSQTWQVGNGQVFTTTSFIAQYTASGSYPISVSGIDINGCIFNSLTTLELKLLTIPNFISPNNDNINDAFEIVGLQPNSATVEVFNRWGSKVYASGNFSYANDWKADGLTDGLYYFTLNLKNLASKTYKGWVQVSR